MTDDDDAYQELRGGIEMMYAEYYHEMETSRRREAELHERLNEVEAILRGLLAGAKLGAWPMVETLSTTPRALSRLKIFWKIICRKNSGENIGEILGQKRKK